MEEEIKIMEFIDTQVVSYKFKNNKKLFDGDIRGRYLSSIVALEFLGIMIKMKTLLRCILLENGVCIR